MGADVSLARIALEESAPFSEWTIKSTSPATSSSSSSSVQRFFVLISEKAFWFRSPAVSFDRTWNEQSGHASFSDAMTRSVWRRASLDWRVPTMKVFLEEGSAWDDVEGDASIVRSRRGCSNGRSGICEGY